MVGETYNIHIEGNNHQKLQLQPKQVVKSFQCPFPPWFSILLRLAYLFLTDSMPFTGDKVILRLFRVVDFGSMSIDSCFEAFLVIA
jgi:hypothetical protein